MSNYDSLEGHNPAAEEEADTKDSKKKPDAEAKAAPEPDAKK